MANTPVLSDDQWQEARRCAEMGLTLREVAEDFGVDYETVRKRAQREEWLTVNKLESLMNEKRKLSENTEKSQIVPKGVEMPIEHVEKRLAAFHTRNKLGLARLAGKGLEKAAEKMEEGILEPKSLSDIRTLAEIAKIAWGGDTNGGNAVQVNVLSSGPLDFSPAFEA